MNKIKALREEIGKLYKCRGNILSQRRLSLMMRYSEDQIYRLENGKSKMTPRFEAALENVGRLARNGDIKIPN